MNIANKLTISRILLVPFIMLFMLPMPFAGATKWNNFVTGLGGCLIALILFLIASITDFWMDTMLESWGLSQILANS